MSGGGSYPEALDALGRLQRFGVRLGLDNVRVALDRFGLPHRRYTVVQIAGTNGKGSTAAMLAASLTRSGYRTGLFTSPHLQRFTERFQVDRQELDRELVAEAILEVIQRAPELTFFEVATVAAALCFSRCEVEVAVFETGLGGRLDATTALEARLCVLTSIDYDHTEVLGADIESIAREKAAIVTRSMPVVAQATGQDPRVKAVFERRCEQQGASLRWVTAPFRGALGLLGEHQRLNAQLCLAAVEPLRALGLERLSTERAVAALGEVRWPGRLEWIGSTLIDCAHNRSAARSLSAFLGQRNDCCLVHGRLVDKPADLALPLLDHCQRIIVTAVDSPRGADPHETALSLRRWTKVPIETASTLQEALDSAGGWKGPTLIAGSVYLAGEARALLTGEPGDPIVIGDPGAAGDGSRER